MLTFRWNSNLHELNDGVTEWLGRGLQILACGFESHSRLQHMEFDMKILATLALAVTMLLPMGAYADEQKKMSVPDPIEVQATTPKVACFSRKDFKKVQEKSGQTLNSAGIMKPNPATQILVRTWNSPNGFWTVTFSKTDGSTCIILQGTDFHQ